MIYKYLLHEIIWEITPKCFNNCDYCGSKELKTKQPLSNHDIIKIAQKIADYPPNEVNISGGDPLTVDLEVHVAITEIFRMNQIKSKIIINPNSYVEAESQDKITNILKLYELIGVSVNTLDDIMLAKQLPIEFRKKYVVITNFNLQNMWMINEIGDFVREADVTWQIQYTVNKDKKDVIYDKSEAVDTLKGFIDVQRRKQTKIVIADNMNSHPCTAGTRSCGILYDGEITPCVSQRSWNSQPMQMGNILTFGLKGIWEDDIKWAEYRRYNIGKSCKGICLHKIDELKDFEPFDMTETYKELQKKFPKDQPITIYYGVTRIDDPKPQKNWWSSGPVMVYGVQTYQPSNIQTFNSNDFITNENDIKDDGPF